MDSAAELEVLGQVEAEHKEDKCDSDSDDESYWEGLEERFKWFPFSPYWDLRSAEPSEMPRREVNCYASPCRCPSTLAGSAVQVLSLMIRGFSFSGKGSPNLFTGEAYVYGIAAVRDSVDLLRSYLFDHKEEKDAQKISFHEGYAELPITLPRRALTADMDIAFEYYLKIKADRDDDPMEIISDYDIRQPSCTGTIIAWDTGKLGSVGAKCAVMPGCVEARVSFTPLRLPHVLPVEGLKVRLAACLDFLDERKLKLELFDGTITWEDNADARTYVIAVPLKDTLQLEFELDGGMPAAPPCKFTPAFHGSTTVEHDLYRSVKFSITVAWSPVHVSPDYPLPGELERN